MSTTTNFYDFLSDLLSSEEKSMVLPALRQDSLIFTGLQTPGHVENMIRCEEYLKKQFTPGDFALAAVHPDRIDASGVTGKIQTSMLEGIMTAFETFKQASRPADSIETVVDVAVALIEKRRIATHWKAVLNEIFRTRGGKTENEVCDAWMTPIMVASQLDTNRDEIFDALTQADSSLSHLMIYVHCVLTQPISQEAKVKMLADAMNNQPEQRQINILAMLQNQAGEQSAADTAKLLLGSRKASSQSIPALAEVWAKPVDSLNLVNRLQNIGTLAQMAHDDEEALNYVQAAENTLEKFTTGLHLQKVAILSRLQQKEQSLELASEILHHDPSNEDVLSELLMALEPENAGQWIEEEQPASTPVLGFMQAKSIETAGNLPLAKEAAANAFKTMMAQPSVLNSAHQPRFAHNFGLAKLFDQLVHYDLVKEAAIIAEKILAENPADLSLIEKSAPVFFQVGDFNQALNHYQTLELLHPESKELKRSKALSQEALGENEQAFRTWKSFVQNFEDATEEDVLHLANSANRIGNVHASIEAAASIPDTSANYGKALIVLGKAYRKLGDTPQAIQYLAKAIETEVDEPEPWLALADLYRKADEVDRSVDTLRAAKSVFPESKEILFALATNLISQNSPSEALSMLTELSAKSPDYLPGQLLTIKTMKSLNHEGVDEKIDELGLRFPGLPEVNYLKGQRALKAGDRNLAKEILSKAVALPDPDPEWLVAYADALAGEDYQRVDQTGNCSTEECVKAKDALVSSTRVESDLLASAVFGEILLKEANVGEAYRVMSEVESKQVTADSEWYWRLQAGVARAATVLGKFDLALASIQEAIGQRPALVGLRQILAEVYKATGDFHAAFDAANQVMVIAPNVVENVLWFATFLTGLGKQPEAEKELQKAISEKPDEIKYRLALADMLTKSGRNSELEATMGGVEAILQANPSEDDLTKAAELYWKNADFKSTAAILEKRAKDFPESAQAKLDLAGVLTQNNEAARAGEILSALQNSNTQDSTAALVNSELSYGLSDFDRAGGLVEGLTDPTLQRSMIVLNPFFPEVWKVLLNQKHPLDYLHSRISYAKGEFQKAADLSKKWAAEEPDNAFAGFYQAKANQALGIDRPVKKAEPPASTPVTVLCAWAQESLDSGELERALGLIERAAATGEQAQWVSTLRVQAAIARGELIEAQVNEGEADLGSVKGLQPVKAEDIAKLGSVIHANKALLHWDDALALASALYRSNTTNLEGVSLYLQIIVAAIETAHLQADLEVKAHAVSSEWLATAKKDFEEIRAAHETTKTKAISHMLNRGKLALAPVQENIRSVALIAPKLDDIVAMMSALHALGEDQTAIQIAKKFETQPKVLNMLAICQEGKDNKIALGTLERSLQVVEGQPETWVAKSILEEKLGEKEAAIQSMENALSYWPEEAEWHIRAAKLWQSAGDAKKAVEHLQMASNLEQQSAEIQYRIGTAYSSMGKAEDAVAMLENAAAKESNRSDILEALADAYYQTGDLEKSIHTADRASIANPFSVKPTLLTGEIELQKGDLVRALEQARLAISKNEKSAEAITFLAKVLLKKGDKSQALAALEKAATSEDATLDLMLKHAHLVREIKGSSNSKTIFEGLVKKYPQNVELMKLLAESQLDCGEKVAAEETARHSLRLESNQPEIHNFLGKLKFDEGNLDQAVYHFSQGIALDNQNIGSYLALARVYQQRRDFHKALETLQQAIQSAPHDSRAYVASANMLREAKDYASAETMLRKAVAIDPKDVNIKRQLGAVIALNLVHKSQQASSQL